MHAWGEGGKRGEEQEGEAAKGFKKHLKQLLGGFPGGPVARTQHFHCRGPRSHKLHSAAKKNFF